MRSCMNICVYACDLCVYPCQCVCYMHFIIMFAPVRAPAHAHPSVRIYIIRSGVYYCSLKYKRLLKYSYFLNFSLEKFGGLENS